MRKLIFLLTLSQALLAQPRENKPLPIFTKKPVKVIDEGIMGWSFSLDGQWISSEMTIPVRLISTNKSQYETRINELGNDNINELQLYPVEFGNDTLVMLVKLYNDGSYEYERTKKGWSDHIIAYYFIFDHKELRKLGGINTQTSNIELALLDYGQVKKTKKKNVLENIKRQVIVKEKTDRFLTFTIRKVEETKTVQFQFACLHDIFSDVEGVLHDAELRGKSIYGKDLLLDYLYYEMDLLQFQDFFTMPTHVEFDRR